MKNSYESETGCCPRFDPAPWDEKEFTWQDKLFIKNHVFCLFHLTITFGIAMFRCMKKIGKADAFPPNPPICLSEYTSPWHLNLYVEVSKEISGAENVKLSGTYLSKVYEGPYNEAGNWCRQTQEWVKRKGKEIKKLLMYFTTCPRCARHYGKNYVVILAQVQE